MRGERRVLRRGTRWGAIVFLLANGVASSGLAAQIPTEFTNLQHYPNDIAPDVLVDEMRRISVALGVRCQSCHVGSTDGVSFEGVDFASDDSPRKLAAREMLRMVDRINAGIETELPFVERRRMEVTCASCHRGAPRPQLLWQYLREALDDGGAASLPAAYSRAREALESGRFNFLPIELNFWAESLDAEGRTDDAVAVLELNLDRHPDDLSILFTLAPLYERLGQVENAVRAYERILEAQPENARVLARLNALRGGQARAPA